MDPELQQKNYVNSKNRLHQIDILRDKLIKIGTPDNATVAIIHDIQTWCITQDQPTATQRSPYYGSLNQMT
jgi:hypothetical protein